MHKGFAFIDVISPCVAFNHNGSTNSYDYVRGHSERLVAADFIARGEEITVNYDSSALEDVGMPDGSTLRLRKLDEDYDPRDRISARSMHTAPPVAAGERALAALLADDRSGLKQVSEAGFSNTRGCRRASVLLADPGHDAREQQAEWADGPGTWEQVRPSCGWRTTTICCARR